jgi:chromosome segregation ATPase
MPQTSGSHGAFLRNITNEVDLLEAERKVAEQLAEMKHRRQQAQLQHQFIQKLMARKQDEEEIEAVMESAKVLREQKDILRNWQAQQRKLEELKEQEVLVQKQMDECSAEMKPVLADQRAIKKDIDKFVQDTADNVKNTEELAWLESEERAAADGKRDPITQQEHFRMDFLLFKNDGWNRVEKIRTSKNKEDRKKLETLEVGLNQLRQNLAILQSDLVEVQRRIAAVENTCKKYQDKSLELNRIFERLPTTRHPTAYDQNPKDGLLDGTFLVNINFLFRFSLKSLGEYPWTLDVPFDCLYLFAGRGK